MIICYCFSLKSEETNLPTVQDKIPESKTHSKDVPSPHSSPHNSKDEQIPFNSTEFVDILSDSDRPIPQTPIQGSPDPFIPRLTLINELEASPCEEGRSLFNPFLSLSSSVTGDTLSNVINESSPRVSTDIELTAVSRVV